MAQSAGTKTKKSAKKKDSSARFWLGIGASAGGLEALRGFVRNLPLHTQATYILAQHMAPQHKSMLTEIIGRDIEISVQDVTDKLKPLANVIYITPPNRNLVVEGDMLRLIDPSKEPAAPKPSVDVFFSSLAKAKGSASVGIILSGTGSDGAKGIREIKTAGGITIAQDELTAKYTGMPLAALDTGCVDLVMSPEEMGAQITKVLKVPRDLDALKASPLSLDGTAELIRLLLAQTKINFLHYKTATFQRRVERRMAAKAVETLDAYVEIAKNSPDEVNMLFKDLLISVTSFFRDSGEFDALRNFLAKLVRQKNGDQIRVWVPGAATGQEAYSIAMLIMEAFPETPIENVRLQLFATDIDSHAIEVARRGLYTYSGMVQVPEDYIDKYFDPAPNGFVVKKSLREKIVFSYHNIANDPPFLNIDLISCRNLLIYFQASLQAEIFNRFHYSLVPEGLLFLGKAEAVSASETLFRPADKEKHIFVQRPSRDKRPPTVEQNWQPAFKQPRAESSKAAEAKTVELAVLRKRFDSLVAALGPDAILVNSELMVIKAFGDLSSYTKLAAGNIDTRVATLINNPYRQDIQSAVPGVIRNRKNYQGVGRPDPKDPAKKIRIVIYPIESFGDEEIQALVVFSSYTDIVQLPLLASSDGVASDLAQQIQELGNELAITKDNLQQTVEELETSNEEMQSLNEELQSSNEELQSTNEELETSNEELQSTNEELSTVNEELQVNAQQLNAVNQSLASILENIAIPLLVVDRHMIVTHASKNSEQFFGLSPDVHLPHVSRCKLKPGYPDLSTILADALETGSEREVYINEANQNAILKVVPHFTGAGELIGAMIIVNDNTRELAEARKELQLIFDNVPAAVIVRDENGNILRANTAVAKLLDVPHDKLEGSNYFDYFAPESRQLKIQLNADLVATGQSLVNFENLVKRRDGKDIWIMKNEVVSANAKDGALRVFAIAQDLTDTHADKIKLAENELRLRQAIKASGLGILDVDFSTRQFYISPDILRMFGLTESDFAGTEAEFYVRMHPDDRDRVRLLRKQHQDGVEKELKYLFRMMRKDGVYVWLEAETGIFPDSKDGFIRVISTLRDITDERAQLSSVQGQKDQLEIAVSLAEMAYWQLDVESQRLSFSNKLLDIFGLDNYETISSVDDFINCFHPDDQHLVESDMTNAWKTGTGFDQTARLLKPDAQQSKIRNLGFPVKDVGGDVRRVYGVLQDITKLTLREEELASLVGELARSNEELNRFSYVCSHDMKEPVRLIQSMAALLTTDGFKTDEALRVDLVERIEINAKRLGGIIDSLLAYSRIDARIETVPVDLNEVITDIQESLALVITEKHARVEAQPLPIALGAKVHFTQVFQNLIGNALKYTDNTHPMIRLHAKKVSGGFEIVVEDNGPGVPEASRKEIFQLFSRLERRDEIEGTGLGLSIVQKIVQQYNGRIECTASNLGGACFVIFLPISAIRSTKQK
jgi:two-component system, chemotaxis family, CheB/CheR fusion protein